MKSLRYNIRSIMMIIAILSVAMAGIAAFAKLDSSGRFDFGAYVVLFGSVAIYLGCALTPIVWLAFKLVTIYRSERSRRRAIESGTPPASSPGPTGRTGEGEVRHP
jgi:hypothetical protein